MLRYKAGVCCSCTMHRGLIVAAGERRITKCLLSKSLCLPLSLLFLSLMAHSSFLHFPIATLFPFLSITINHIFLCVIFPFLLPPHATVHSFLSFSSLPKWEECWGRGGSRSNEGGESKREKERAHLWPNKEQVLIIYSALQPQANHSPSLP